MTVFTPDELRARIGQELGTSDWVTIDQAAIDQFAACTGDRQFIHTDPDRARQSPFGGTIAHGLLTLSILAPLQQPFTQVEGTAMTVNCGFNRVRVHHTGSGRQPDPRPLHPESG
ncbi:MaoC family dehydratase [Hoeflea sp. BAL378]|uniref:MaoC family dehydratase n=1 Tax=Hoeflea sp. BAL378 TaxID=1547437 RepID=UPI000AA3AFA2|nr:MaoC family dehydratase [Hoeflea sp. BAL378]